MVLVLDTNLLVLLVVGLVGEELIERHKRLNAFNVGDFRQLVGIVETASKLLFVPHVLAETSNLVRSVEEPRRTNVTALLGRLIGTTEERPVASQAVVNDTTYLRLGLTDAVLLSLVDRTHTLLTVDFDLYLAASRAGGNARDFNHERGLWQ